MNKFIILILTILTFIGCTHVVYPELVPKNAEIQASIPELYLGEYIELNTDADYLGAILHKIEEIDNGDVRVVSEYLNLKDSLLSENYNLKHIENVILDSDNLIVIRKEKRELIKLALADTVVPYGQVYHMNFEDELYCEKGMDDTTCHKMYLKASGDSLFFNIEYKEGLWWVITAYPEMHGFRQSSSVFLKPDDSTELLNFILDYSLESYSRPLNILKESCYVSNDSVSPVIELMEHKYFIWRFWYKQETVYPKKSKYLLFGGLTVVLLLMVYISFFRRRNDLK